ncbi:MAG: YicC/YloC family endoribonuclease [Porticoccaceae bacterium]
MPSSMTAFARTTGQVPGGALTWELRSVNHRFLEPHFRLPDTLRELEMPLRDILRERLPRGKIDATLTLTETADDTRITIDENRINAYVGACAQIAALVPHSAPVSSLDLLRMPGVVRVAAPDREVLTRTATDLFQHALTELAAARRREGEQLATLIRDRLDRIDREVEKMRALLPELLAAQRAKLRARLAELVAQIDSDRLEQELAYLAQRADVDEELDRLATHSSEFRRALATSGAIGRRLDFLSQELNREANTLGSKSISTATTQAAVQMKVLIEQIREQVQNLE